MKRVGILTFHFVHNYGALLQSYALQQYLQSCKVYSRFINYVPDDHAKQYRLNIDIIKHIRRLDFRRAFRCLRLYILDRRFERFIRKNLKTTKLFQTAEDLVSNALDYDCVLVGSDQVWNDKITGSIDTYFLDFIKKGKKIAWAASLGDTISEEQGIRIKRLLPNFDAVFLRESQHLGFFEAVYGKDVGVVLDPVFLLSPSDWRNFAKKSLVSRRKKSYLLIYCLGDEVELVERVKTLNSKKNLPVIIVHPLGKRLKNVGDNLYSVGPIEFVYLLDNAAMVISDSFHAIAMCLLLGVSIAPVLQKNNCGRIVNLFDLLSIPRDVLVYQTDSIATRIIEERAKLMRATLMGVINEP